MHRGDIFEFKMPKGVGHEQQGRRYAVVVQADTLLPRSVVLVAPTSRSAKPASFRPEMVIAKQETRVLVEQVGAVDVSRLGKHVGNASPRKCGASTKRSSPCWAWTEPPQTFWASSAVTAADDTNILGLSPDELVHLDEPGSPATLDQLTRLLPQLVPDRLDDLLAVGVIDHCGPDRYCVPSPSLLQLTVDALATGYTPDAVLSLLTAVHDAAELVAGAATELPLPAACRDGPPAA